MKENKADAKRDAIILIPRSSNSQILMDSPGAVVCIDCISIRPSKWIGFNKPGGGYIILKRDYGQALPIYFQKLSILELFRFPSL